MSTTTIRDEYLAIVAPVVHSSSAILDAARALDHLTSDIAGRDNLTDDERDEGQHAARVAHALYVIADTLAPGID